MRKALQSYPNRSVNSSEKVSQIYLDSFENSQIDEAMKNLL